jgi:hypothetical protein
MGNVEEVWKRKVEKYLRAAEEALKALTEGE